MNGYCFYFFRFCPPFVRHNKKPRDFSRGTNELFCIFTNVMQRYELFFIFTRLILHESEILVEHLTQFVDIFHQFALAIIIDK